MTTAKSDKKPKLTAKKTTKATNKAKKVTKKAVAKKVVKKPTAKKVVKKTVAKKLVKKIVAKKKVVPLKKAKTAKKPVVPTDQVIGNTLEQSEQVMLAFADLHGRWWNSPDLKHMAWTAPITHVTPIKESLAQLEDSISNAERTGRFDAYPNMKRLQPRLPPLFAMEPPQPEPYTLVHGDLRSDNIFFSPESPTGEPTIIDWQTAGIGQPMTDIARWLTQSIDIDLRRQHETHLLKLYHDRLLANGVENYSYKKMLQEYEINLVVTLLMFSMSMDEIEQTSERAAPLFHAMYSRLDAALVDWDVEKTLKILPFMIPFMKLGNWIKTIFN